MSIYEYDEEPARRAIGDRAEMQDPFSLPGTAIIRLFRAGSWQKEIFGGMMNILLF